MPRVSSNDMVHNHYLDEARKKTQERDRNSKTSVIPSARFQSTADGSKPKPRSNNQTSRSLPVSKSSCVTITAVPKADHSKSSSLLRFQTLCLFYMKIYSLLDQHKVDIEPPNGSNADITNQYESTQTLDVSAGTSNLSAGTSFNPKKEGLRVWLLKRLISEKPGLHVKFSIYAYRDDV
ncbi:hypothetical protein Tco_1352330 [Tanacetum coccineum]